MFARMSRFLPVMILTILGVVSTPWPGGDGIACPVAMMTNLTKDNVRIELQANHLRGDKEQCINMKRIYERAYLEFLRNGWRNEGSGKYMGAVILEYEARAKGGVVHVEVRIREAGTDTVYQDSKAEIRPWDELAVRLMESCIVDSGYWK